MLEGEIDVAESFPTLNITMNNIVAMEIHETIHDLTGVPSNMVMNMKVYTPVCAYSPSNYFLGKWTKGV